MTLHYEAPCEVRVGGRKTMGAGPKPIERVKVLLTSHQCQAASAGSLKPVQGGRCNAGRGKR